MFKRFKKYLSRIDDGTLAPVVILAIWVLMIGYCKLILVIGEAQQTTSSL